jgi:hypothetical protein
MKTRLFILLLIISSLQVLGQKLINVNPDPNGEPWYAGNLRTLTVEDLRKIERTPKLTLPVSFQKGSLPSSVNNSLNKYFRPVFNQANGSCGQASGVGYNYTYAINFARNLTSNTTQTQYPTHYTYNFLNGGAADNGSFYFDGWEIINANGCPNVATYGGTLNAKGLTGWMNGYDNYYNGMKNRSLEVYTIDVSTPQGLETLKAWMVDQLNGSSVGGLANFSGGVYGASQGGTFKTNYLPTGTPEQGKTVITYWDSQVNHAMTFVGYNDNICFDFNGDGQYTNNKDINGDGILDMRDWEVGALIMVNSWGLTFGEGGKAYVPYKLLAEPKTNGGIGSSIVHVLRAKATYSPKATIKATITHSSREKLRITAGVSTNPSATKPDYTLQIPLFNFQGGSEYMQGGTTFTANKTIEIGLDITPLLSYINSGQDARFFLVVEEKDPTSQAIGSIVGFSVIDYSNGTSEAISQQTNVSIANNDTTFLTVNKVFTVDKVQVSTQTLPDAAAGYAYNFTMSALNGTAPYSWDFMLNYNENKKISPFQSVTNQALMPSDPDDGFADINLQFSFPFYDKVYNKIKVTTDGSVLFGSQFEYVRDFPGLMATRAITVYGADLMIYPSDGDGIWYKSTTDSITIRWKTSKYTNTGDMSFNTDCSVTLFPSGLIRFNYGSGISSSTNWIAGVSMGNGISYNTTSISGYNTIPANTRIDFTTAGFPEGLEINKDGKMTFTPKEVNKTWNITAKVTDYNKISSNKTIALHSTNILTFSYDTLKFNSATAPNPWQTGKDLTITNSYSQPVDIKNIDWNGFGWFVSDNPLTYPYTINAGASLTINVKLKSSFSKSANFVLDSFRVVTDNVLYQLPIVIDPSIYSAPTYAITFNVTTSLGPLAGAIISIENITSLATTNGAGVASIGLLDGSYNYTITYNNHTPYSGSFTVSGATQTINAFLQTMGVEPNSLEQVKVYPNPFTNEIYVDCDPNALVSVYDLIGNRVIQSYSMNHRIDTRKLPKGIYILNVVEKNGAKVSKKIVKN